MTTQSNGTSELLQVRLSGLPVLRIDIEILPAGWQRLGDVGGFVVSGGKQVLGLIALAAADDPAAVDFSCCLGAPVCVFADSAQDAAPFLPYIERAKPSRLTLAAADLAVSDLTSEEPKSWAL